MKYETSKLTGALLDQAVAKAKKYSYAVEIDQTVVSVDGGMAIFFSSCLAVIDGQLRCFSPSSDWRDGGPIIAENHISIMEDADTRGDWNACGEFQFQGGIVGQYGSGETPLIAAMRYFVCAKIGEEIDLP